MRHLTVAMLGAALCVGAAPAAQAAAVGDSVLLSMPYSIGTLTKTLQFLGDGSVRICDGSVLVACDGSVRAGDGSVTPGQDAMLLSSVSFSPNPFISFGLSFLDFGTPTTLLATVGGPLLLGASSYAYDLTGSATLTDAEGGSVSMGATSLGAFNGLIFGAVDGSVVDAIGAGGAGVPGSGVTPQGRGKVRRA